MNLLTKVPLLIFALVSSLAWAGTGSDGGGGCSIQYQGNWILKDFLRAKLLHRHLIYSGQKLNLSFVGKQLGFEPLDGRYGANSIQQSQAYQYVLQRLTEWQQGLGEFPQAQGSLRLIEKLAWALERVNFTAVPYQFLPKAFGCTAENEVPILIYGADYETALLSLSQWGQLDVQSQAGALLKEAFRFLQTENNTTLFASKSMDEESERRISLTLSLIILTNPNEAVSNSDPLFHAFVAQNDEMKNHAQNMEDFRQIESLKIRVNEWCTKHSKVLVKYEINEAELGLCAPELNAKKYSDLAKQVSDEVSKIHGLLRRKAWRSRDLTTINFYISAKEDLLQIDRYLMFQDLKVIDRDPIVQQTVNALTEINQGARRCLIQTWPCDVGGISSIVKSLRENFYSGQGQDVDHTNLQEIRRQFLQTISAKVLIFKK